MTDDDRSADAALPPVPDWAMRAARTTGWLFIATFVTSIPGLLLYGPVLNETGYILGSGSDTQVTF